MRQLLIGAVRLYQRHFRAQIGRTCIFEESCSRRVLAVTEAFGAMAGLLELNRRYRQCRPGYRPLQLRSPEGEALFLLADSSVVPACLLTAQVRREFAEHV